MEEERRGQFTLSNNPGGQIGTMGPSELRDPVGSSPSQRPRLELNPLLLLTGHAAVWTLLLPLRPPRLQLFGVLVRGKVDPSTLMMLMFMVSMETPGNPGPFPRLQAEARLHVYLEDDLLVFRSGFFPFFCWNISVFSWRSSSFFT